MTRRTLQDPAMKTVILANANTRDRDGISIMLWPDGSLCLEPNGEPSKVFEHFVMLTPQQTEALSRFFDGSRVRDRIADMLRRKLLRNPETRKLVQWMDRALAAQEAR
jgi:hypothetical protein